MAGGSKLKSYSLTVGEQMKSGDECTLQFVQARPWMFKGFNDDGSYEKGNEMQNLTIPIHISNTGINDL